MTQNIFETSWRGKQSQGEKRVGEMLGTNFRIKAHRGGAYWDVECLRCGTVTPRHTNTFSQMSRAANCRKCPTVKE